LRRIARVLVNALSDISSTEKDPAGKKIKQNPRAGVELSFLEIITIDVAIRKIVLTCFE